MTNTKGTAALLSENVVKETENDTESIIQYFLEAYKNYLVQCIDYKDLLFYKYFSPANRKYFREMARLQDGESVTHCMIDMILSMNSISDRFVALVKLFEDEFENEKVLRILKGEKVPSNRLQNKERIQRVCMKELCENLHVNEIIPKLVNKHLILDREGEYLRKKANSESQFDAAVDLLLILPARHTNWYARFMYCLIDTGHEVLAEKVDQDICRRIIAEKKLTERQADDLEGSVTSNNMIENLSLVSGPMKTCNSYKELLTQCTTRYKVEVSVPSNDQENLAHEVVVEKTFHKSSLSPKDERVFDWVMASKVVPDDSKLESDSWNYSNHRTFKKRQHIVRKSSLIKNSASKAYFESTMPRHFTMQVPFSQIQQLKAESITPVHIIDENKWFPEVSGLEDFSCKSSVVSSFENLCIDNYVDENNIHPGLLHSYSKDSIVVVQSCVSGTSTNIGSKCDDDHLTESIEEQQTVSRQFRQTTHKGRREDSVFSALTQLFSKANLHPVKIAMILKEKNEVLSACKLLSWMCGRALFYEDETSALKFHYISSVIQLAKSAESLDGWIHKIVTGRETDGFFEFQDKVVRQVVDGFPHQESSLVKRIKARLKKLNVGDGLESLKILIRGLNEDLLSQDGELGHTVGGSKANFPGKADKMPVCSMIEHYCASDVRMPLKDFDRTEISTNDPVHPLIMEQLTKACEGESYSCRIITIQRIRNVTFLEKYSQHKDMLSRKAAGRYNERLLYGSSNMSVTEDGIQHEQNQQICQNLLFACFPILFEQSGHSLNGQIRNSSCINSPCDCRRNILLCRVFLGNSFLDSSETRNNLPQGYHSLIIRQWDTGSLVQKYRVKSVKQVNPEYLVTFTLEHQ